MKRKFKDQLRYILFSIVLLGSGLSGYAQPYNNAIVLNGVNDFITVPNNANLNQTATISVEAWVKPCKVSGDNMVISKNWCAGTQNAYYLNIKDGKLVWKWDSDGCGNGADVYTSDLAIIQVNQWQHVAVVHTPTAVTLYLNGVPVAGNLFSGAYGNILASNEPFRIGVYRVVSGAFALHYQGLIDEVRVWSNDLTAAEYFSKI